MSGSISYIVVTFAAKNRLFIGFSLQNSRNVVEQINALHPSFYPYPPKQLMAQPARRQTAF